jgi:hypothetical protein
MSLYYAPLRPLALASTLEVLPGTGCQLSKPGTSLTTWNGEGVPAYDTCSTGFITSPPKVRNALHDLL